MRFSGSSMILILFSLFEMGIGSTIATGKESQPAAQAKLLILHTNDTHGHPLCFDDYPQQCVGGIPARKTLIDKYRKEYENLLLLDAGDLNTGRPESNFFKAEPDIRAYNILKYDAVAVGNHEFDNSTALFALQIKQANFPFLAANLKSKDATISFKPYVVKQMKGFKVGILGLITQETSFVGSYNTVRNFVFEDEVETAKKNLTLLKNKEKVDVVIALTHMGLYDDNNLGSKRLAAMVPGIDLIVDGHSHTRLTQAVYEHGTPIVQAFRYGEMLGKAELTLKNKKVDSFKWEAIPINMQERVITADGKEELKYLGEKVSEDKEIREMLQAYADKTEKILTETVGTNEEELSFEDTRNFETKIAQVVADANKSFTDKFKVDFAMVNGGTIRASLGLGKITKKKIYEMLPFDKTLVTVDLVATQIKELCDFMATTTGKGSFGVLSRGIEMKIDYKKEKCLEVKVGGKPLDPVRIYKVGTDSYLLQGGDGYSVFKKAKNSYDTAVYWRDAFIDYIAKLGGVIKKTDFNKRIIVVN